jgi:hypothetical protein
MYEIRPVWLYRSGVPFPLTEAKIDGAAVSAFDSDSVDR